MADAIGRGDYVLGVDKSGVAKGVAAAEQDIARSGAKTEKAYAESGRRASAAFSSALQTGAKVAGMVVAGVSAVALKGLKELDDFQADFRAETGATAEEARRAGDAINRMSSRNIQPLGEIGKTLTKVHTDLGLVGEEADQETERFLRFARATKQDASAAVLAFDDILDAWGLTAADSGRLMDQLVASHQKFGGSIEANQAALAAMAPQLRALNMTVDDGIGLLNLFASSGLDAASGQRALNTAIAKLPPGETMDQFLLRLSKIDDDGKRAQAAMEVFGSKAGAGLANAIRPGVASLDAFKITQEEATGATEEAARALDDTFGARVQLMINKAGAAIRDYGRDLGPVLMTLTSLGGIAGALGLDKVVEKLGPKVAEAFKAVGSKAGEALIDGVGTATGAAGTVIGNLIADPIAAALDPERNSLLGKVYRATAAKAAIVWATAFKVTSKLGDLVLDAFTAVFNRLPIAGPVRAAVLAAGIKLGTLQGTAMGTAAFAAAALAIATAGAIAIAIAFKFVTDDIHEQEEALRQKTEEFATQATLEGLQKARVAVAEKLKALGNDPIGEALGVTAHKGIRTTLDQLDAEIHARLVAMSQTSARDIAEAAPAIGQASKVAFEPIVTNSGLAWLRTFEQTKRDAKRAGNLAAGALAQGITESRQKPVDAFEVMLDMLKNATTKTAETQRLLGQLTSKELVKGLRSHDPAVKAQAQYTKQLIIDRLEELKVSSGSLSKESAKLLAKGLKSKDPDIRQAALDIKALVDKPLKTLKDAAKTYGENTGTAYANGLQSPLVLGAITAAARKAAAAAGKILRAFSPPGPESPLHEIDVWGRRTMEAYADGILRARGTVREALLDVMSMGSGSGAALSVIGSTTGSVSVNVNHRITAEGARALRDAGFDETRVAAALGSSDATGLFGNIRQLAAMTS